MLLDVIQQRIGDHDLIPHAGDHGFDVREQVSVQLRVAEQVVVIVGVDIAQDVVDQRFVVIRVNGAQGYLWICRAAMCTQSQLSSEGESALPASCWIVTAISFAASRTFSSTSSAWNSGSG